MKIVIFDPLSVDESSVAKIRQTAAGAEVVVSTKDQLSDDLNGAEVFYGFHTPEVFSGAAKLRWIQSTAAGMEKMLDPQFQERGITLTNASGVHGPQVTEMAWALTLALTRALPIFFRQQQEHRWEYGPGADLECSVAGIIGLGGIGRRYAKVAAAFGMRVLAVDPHNPPKPDEVESLWKLDRLDDLLAVSDVVLVACPYTEETKYLIDGQRLAKMKPTAIVINIARGGIVEETALIEALQAGRLGGAGLDVCETEPLPADNPLWDVPNLIITPHCAGLSPNRMRRLCDFFCENLKRYQVGESLHNVIDYEKGYPVT